MTPERRTRLTPPPPPSPPTSRTPAITSILTFAALALLVLVASVVPMPARGQSSDDAAVDLVDPVPANLYTQFPDDELAWWPDGRQNEVYAVLVDDPDLYTVDGSGKKTISWNNALNTCRLFGGNVATMDQLQDAYEQGAAWCHCGIIGTMDDNQFAYPTQTPSSGCGSSPGVQTCDVRYERNMATCFGVKPATAMVEARAPKDTLFDFTRGQSPRWSRYCGTEGAAGCPSSVQSVAEDGEVASHTISRLRFAVPRPVPYQEDTRIPKTVLAKGRFISNDADQLVAMTKVGNFTKDNNCFSFDLELAGFIDPNVSDATFPGWSVRPCLAGRSVWYESPFDLAAGDLDRAVDPQGELHDELVIVHEEGDASLAPPGVVRLHVLDYSADPTDPVETAYTLPSDDAHAYDRLGYRKDGKGEVYPGVLLAETFDASGTGAKLIATVHSSNQLSGQSGYVVNVLSYSPPSGEGHAGTITPIGDQTFSLSRPSGRDVPSSASLAAGDFDGDGDEELALLYTDHDGAHLAVLTAVPGKGVEVLSREWTDASLSTATIPVAKLVAGLFFFEPEKGFDLGRRQLALGYWTGQDRSLGVKVLRLDGASKVAQVTELSAHPYTTIVDFGFAAGNFAGTKAQQPNPIWSIALGSLYEAEVTPEYQVQLIDPVADRVTDTVRQKWFANEYPALLAFDQDGDSLYLGAPVTFEAKGTQQLLSTLEQPPQHLDYLPNEPGANGVGLLDVSRDSAFKLTFSESVDSKLGSDLSSTGAWNIGGSAKASASFTIKERIPFIEKGTIKSTLTPFIEGAYSHSSTSSSGNRSSVKVEMSESPVDDDALYLTMQSYEIWRYRLYGAETDDPNAPYAYYEVLRPVGLVTSGWFAGLTSDPYQPLHENGNILSYPDIHKNDPGSPPDLGSWSPTALPPGCSEPALPDTSYTTPLTGDMAHVLEVSGVQSTLKVALSKTDTCGGKRQSGWKLKGGGDFRAVLSVTEKEVLAKETERGTVDLHVGSDSSWSDLSSWNVTTEESENLAITTVASADPSFNYQFAPSLYFADDGNLRVTFYASTPEQTQSWWATTYGSPDPALNLPLKYIAPNQKDWQPNTSMDAGRIRGFYLRDGDPPEPSEIDPATGLGPLLASVPEHGDQVQVEVMVYNYSVKQGVTSLPVRFDIADYDALTDTVSNRRVLGKVTAEFTDEHATQDGRALGKTFPPRGVGRAVYPLDTSILPNVAEVSDYVIYAVLNPEGDSPTEETHPWRSPDVTVMAFTQGRENVGATLELSITDQNGKALDTVKATSSGDIAQDVQALAAAFNGSDVAGTYGVEAIDYLPGEADDPSALLVLTAAGNSSLPSSSEFRATLAFDEAVAGVTELHVIPSVSGPGNGTMTASNLAPGQNNEGYGFFAMAGSESQPASAVALEATTLAAADLSGRIVDGRASGAVGRRLRLRVCAHADGTFRGIVDVPVFLGDPAEGKGLAIKRLHGVDQDGSCAWFDWTPPAAGQYTVQTVLPQAAASAKAAQAMVSDSLTIQVQ